jgi:hypothetical protein
MNGLNFVLFSPFVLMMTVLILPVTKLHEKMRISKRARDEKAAGRPACPQARLCAAQRQRMLCGARNRPAEKLIP